MTGPSRIARGASAAGHVVTLVAWIYLYIVTMLGAWVAIVVVTTGWDPVVITSGSMAPTLRPGDVLVVDQHPDDELLGQRSVITFESPRGDDELITHRIAEVIADNRLYITQGDANLTRDTDPVTVDQVQGVGRLVVPVIGLPVVWAQDGNITALVGIGVLSAAALAAAFRAARMGRERSPGGGSSAMADRAIRRVRLLVALMIASQFFLDGGRFEVEALGLSRPQLLVLACGGLGAVNLLSLSASKNPTRYRRIDLIELAADTGLVIVLTTATGGGGIGWVLIALPIVEAAVRFRLAGALMHWMGMAAMTLTLRLWVLDRSSAPVSEIIDELETVLDQLGVLLLVAIPGAYLAEQLVTDVALQRRATDDALERGRLLEQVAQVGQRINRIGTELFDTLVEAVVELGYGAADVHLQLPNGTWKTLAHHGEDIALPEPGAAGSGLRDEDLDLLSVIVDQDDPDLAEFVPLAGAGLRSVARVSLSQDDETFIVLRAAERRGDDIGRGTVEALQLLCAQATVALQNNQLMTELRSMHDELEHQANHDALTGLPNRARFLSELKAQLAAATDPRRRHVVIFLDLNGFKAVNDTMGHDAGDVLLQQVAERLTTAVGGDGLLARLGGDEFTVLLEPLDSPDQARMHASKIHAALAEPFDLSGKQAAIAASVGMAYPEPGVDESELLRRADAAMYAAKAAGGPGRTEWYHPRLDEGERRRGRMAAEFKKALENDDLSLEYQPLVQADSGAIVGAEALLRWHHRELGTVNTATILELADVSDRVDQLNAWIVATALAGLRSCAVAEHHPFFMAINVSPAELESEQVANHLGDALLTAGVAPERVVVELSERMVTEDEATRRHIDVIANLGVQLSLDDFGEGRTSLAHLRGLPISQLKLDRLLVQQARSSDTDRIILESVSTLAHELGMTVVAEGVETNEDQQMASDAGADLLQGYGLYRPMPLDRLQTLLVRAGVVQTTTRDDHPNAAEVR